MLLENIQSPADVKALSADQLTDLCAEARTVLLQKLSDHGGHIGPNLGMVEATVALHRVFHSPTDKIIYDVSHQSYIHKMLTGRADAFLNPEKYDDVSGYTEPSESEHDLFVIGHTSTSISLACGLAKGRDLCGGTENVIALIGDGSLSGGEALEGLNTAAELESNLIIIVNDNQMSIAENHGGLYKTLARLRETNGTSPDNLFRAMGLDYRYVAEGNNVAALIEAFEAVRDIDHPIVLHINTVKGCGYAPAEAHKERFHWGFPFDLATGETKPAYHFGESYADITGRLLLDEMEQDPTVVAIAAGTPSLFGFTPDVRRRAGRQFVDVGIAEQTAVAMASGIAKRGGKPVFATASTFMQRAYDQLAQDVCVNETAPLFLLTYATICGMNDVTHLGFFDIPLIANIPNMIFLSPATKEEYIAMTHWAIHQTHTAVTIRMPSRVVSTGETVASDFSLTPKSVVTRRGTKVALLGLGNFLHLAHQVADALAAKGVDATVVNPRYANGVDAELLDELAADHTLFVALEDGCLAGGWAEKVAAHFAMTDRKVLLRGATREFQDRYDYTALLSEYRLLPEQIVDDVLQVL